MCAWSAGTTLCLNTDFNNYHFWLFSGKKARISFLENVLTFAIFELKFDFDDAFWRKQKV